VKLQENTRLALYSVLEFAAQPGRQLSAAEIASRYDVSPHHLAKVLKKLRGAGVLAAARGAGGGYRFAANPKRVTLLEVIALFEQIGPARVGPGAHNAVERALEQVLAEIDENARATFGSITITTMLKLMERHR
jgi:Rrf2 family nitric oxide-sensitive transcriptional repressor